MALLLADENFDFRVVRALLAFGHDIVTIQSLGLGGQKYPDADVLNTATLLGRVTVTFNHRDFRRLHRSMPAHAGIIACTRDDDVMALASRIDDALLGESNLAAQYVRIVRPS